MYSYAVLYVPTVHIITGDRCECWVLKENCTFDAHGLPLCCLNLPAMLFTPLLKEWKGIFFGGGVFFGLLLVAGAGEKIQSLLLDLKNASNWAASIL